MRIFHARGISILAAICLLQLLPDVVRGDELPPETILHNGDVYTVNAQQPRAQAIAFRDGRIAAVGSDEEVLALAGPDTRVVDLEGAFVLPGFIDTHVHFQSAASFYEFNLMKTASQEDFVDRVEQLASTLADGEWITGGYWGAYEQWKLGSAGDEQTESFTPDMSLVEAATQQHPLFIRKFDNSEFAANRAALSAVGLDPETLEPVDDVQFVRDADGNFAGRMRGPGVMELFREVLPKRPSHERRVRQTRHALRMAAEYGVTSLSDMSDDHQLEIYRELRERDELTVRVDFRYTLDRWRELAVRGVKAGSGDDWIRLGGLKGFVDGIMGDSSARFYEPYTSDAANRGRWRTMMTDRQGRYAPDQFLNYMLGADKAGLQITVHAIGDEANHLLLDFVEQMIEQNGRRDRRFRLVHAQVVADDDFARLGALDVIAEVQPFHLSDDMRWMETRIGHRRCRNAYAFKRIMDSGAVVCFGSDWPGTSAAEYPINPLLAIYAAVTRQTVTGVPVGGWFPAERIDVETAIRAHTLDAAYASFEEVLKGSIEAGKLADLTVLDTNLLEVAPARFLEAKVEYTMVGGKLVYSRRR